MPIPSRGPSTEYAGRSKTASRHHSGTRRRASVSAATAVCAVTVSATSACGLSLGAQQDAMSAFIEAFNNRDAAAAAAQTTSPTTALPAIMDTFEGMGQATPDLSTVQSLSGDLTTHIAWTLPDGSKAETTGDIGELEDGKVPWSPHIIDSRMQPGGRMVYTRLIDHSSPVTGRDQQPIMTWQTVTAVRIASDAPQSDVAALADALHDVDPAVTAPSINAELTAAAQTTHDAPSTPDPRGVRDDDAQTDDYVTVIDLRPANVDPVREKLDAIPSVALIEKGRLLTVDPDLHSPALNDVPATWRKILEATAGWSVEIDNPGPEDVKVKADPPDDVQNVPIALDATLQSAAQQAVVGSNTAAAIVAISPSDGGIRAVAQNDAAGARGPVALSGLYSPGSVFGIVTTAAAIGAGDTAPDDAVDCPAAITIDGTAVRNDDGFSMARGPLKKAFGEPCDTTQALLAEELPPSSLHSTALSLGLGADPSIPGLIAATGDVPAADSTGGRAATGIGQGSAAASPFGMAVLAASLANGGTAIHPALFTADPDTLPADEEDGGSDGDPGGTGHDSSDSTDRDAAHSVSKKTASQVISMMRGTIVDGALRQLDDTDGIPDDLAARAGDSATGARRGHGWFVGITQDEDLAFVVFVQNAGSAQPAIDMAKAFLTAGDTGSGD